MKLIRLIVLIILGLAMLAGFVFLAIQPGEIVYNDGAKKVSVGPGVAAAMLMAITIMMTATWGFIGWLWSLPGRMKRAQQENARKKCLDTLGLSMAAFESGEISEARRQAQKALGFAPDAAR